MNLEDLVSDPLLRDEVAPFFDPDAGFEQRYQWQAYVDVLTGFSSFYARLGRALEHLEEHNITELEPLVVGEDSCIQGLVRSVVQEDERTRASLVSLFFKNGAVVTHKYSHPLDWKKWPITQPLQVEVYTDAIEFCVLNVEYVKDSLGELRRLVEIFVRKVETMNIYRVRSLHQMYVDKPGVPGFQLVEAMTTQEGQEWGEKEREQELTERRTGSLIPGYRIIEKVGEGSGRVTYKAWDETDECFVAIKVTRAGIDSSNRERIADAYGSSGLAAKEAIAARQLTHPNIVRYFGRGQLEDGRDYIIEEFLDGETLRDLIFKGLITDFEFVNDSWPTKEVLARGVLEGTAYIHERGLVHRDLKPRNILLSYRHCDEIERVKVGDLELVTKPGEGVTNHGSRGYSAPEVLSGSEPYTQAADVFSLGVVVYEIFTGQHPFGKGTSAEIGQRICDPTNYEKIKRRTANSMDIPTAWKPVITKALAYDKEERYKDASDLKEDLEQNKVKEKRRKRRRFFGAIAGAAVVCAGVLGIFGYQVNQNHIAQQEAARVEAIEQRIVDYQTRIDQANTVELQEVIAEIASDKDLTNQQRQENIKSAQAKEVERRKRAQEVFAFAKRLEEEKEETGRTNLYYAIRDAYEGVIAVDPMHGQAHARLCDLNSVRFLRTNAVRAAYPLYGVDVLWEIQNLSKDIILRDSGEINLALVEKPSVEDVIENCRKAEVLLPGENREVILTLSKLYEREFRFTQAIAAIDRYVATFDKTEKDAPEEEVAAVNRRSRLYIRTGQVRRAYDTHKVHVKIDGNWTHREKGMNEPRIADIEMKTIRAELALRLCKDPTLIQDERERVGSKGVSPFGAGHGAIANAVWAIRSFDNFDEEEHGWASRKKHLTPTYYQYGIARLYQVEQGWEDRPISYILDREEAERLRKSQVKEGRFTSLEIVDAREVEYYPKPLDDAITALEYTVALDDTHIDAHVALAQAYTLAERKDDAALAQRRADQLERYEKERLEAIRFISLAYPTNQAVHLFSPSGMFPLVENIYMDRGSNVRARDLGMHLTPLSIEEWPHDN